MNAEAVVSPDIEMSPAVLLSAVESFSGLSVSRSTLYRWRVALGIPEPPYDQRHVIALSKYGNFLRLGLTPSRAKEKTYQYLEQIGL